MRLEHFQLQDQYFTSWSYKCSMVTVLLFRLKFHPGPQTQQRQLTLIKLHLGDMPSAIWLFQENGNIHLAITVTTRAWTIQRKTFFLWFYILSHQFLFSISLWKLLYKSLVTWCLLDFFLLTFCTYHLFFPLCTWQTR